MAYHHHGDSQLAAQLQNQIEHASLHGEVEPRGDLVQKQQGRTVGERLGDLDALLHDHAVDYGLWNKLFSADLLTEEMLDNGLAYNEDLLANWRAFLAAPGCAFCDFAGYHYRQHADSASHRALPPQSIDDQRRAAAEIRATAPAEMQQSVNAFYYEKLVYLASMILRRANAADYRVQLNELKIGIAAGADDPQLGRNPLLPRSIRLSAWLTLHMPRLWQWACRNFLKDRQ